MALDIGLRSLPPAKAAPAAAAPPNQFSWNRIPHPHRHNLCLNHQLGRVPPTPAIRARTVGTNVADWCIHAANVIYLVSFLTRDMMWLRLLTCCGLGFGIVFFTCQPAPMYGPTAWHVVFVLINVMQIRRLVVERRRLKLSREREQVAQAAFKDLSRDEMLNLLTRAMCTQAERLPDLRKAAREPLSEDEQVVRDIAFRGLSNKEVLNLLTRRLWHSLWWVNPIRWRRRRAEDRVTPALSAAPRSDRSEYEPLGGSVS